MHVCVYMNKVYSHVIPAMLCRYALVRVYMNKVYAHGNCLKAMHVCACVWS